MATNKPNLPAQAGAEDKTPHIRPNTPEMERFLQAGYPGMTVEKAKTIIAERKASPLSWPYSEKEKAEAFLAAYETAPRAIDPHPGHAPKDRA